MSTADHADGKVVISGIGRSQIGRRLNQESLDLTIDACLAAVTDAGLTLADIDGLETWPGDFPGGSGGRGFAGPGLQTIQDVLRLRLNWYAAGMEGLQLLGYIVDGTMAVATGRARHVLLVRTLTESSARNGQRRQPGFRAGGQAQWWAPYGATAAHLAALHARSHFDTYGTTEEHLGHVVVNQRRNAAKNPAAIYRDPLTLDDYFASRVITTPLRLFDCDVPADGATAFVLSPAAYAKDCPHVAVTVEAAGTARRGRAIWQHRYDQTTMTAHDAAAHMWSRTDLKPGDVDVAQLYDGFSIFVLMWLEALGLCTPGDSGAFVEGGDRISLTGQLPLNTAGGQLSEGRFVGSGQIYESCLQLRGEAGDRQVPGAEVAVVGVGGGNTGQAMLLTKQGS